MKNPKVVFYSLLALGFMALTFLVDWIFIVGAIIFVYISQKKLIKK